MKNRLPLEKQGSSDAMRELTRCTFTKKSMQVFEGKPN